MQEQLLNGEEAQKKKNEFAETQKNLKLIEEKLGMSHIHLYKLI